MFCLANNDDDDGLIYKFVKEKNFAFVYASPSPSAFQCDRKLKTFGQII